MRRPLCLLCLFYVAGLILILGLFPPFEGENEQLQNKKTCMLSGEVYRMESKNDKSILYLKASRAETHDLRVICYVEEAKIFSRIKIGNRVSVSGTCRMFEEASNDGQFDARLYYRVQGISCFMTGCRVFLENDGFKPYEQGLFVIRRYLSRTLKNTLPPKYAGVMQAVFLGEKGELDEEIKELFQRNGISHVFAISGLHISFLGMGIFRFLKRIRIPSFAGVFLTAALIAGFGIMTGNSASAIRSMIMFLLFLLAGLCGRTYDMLTAAAFSGMALLFKQPLYIYHSGFLLSFGAVMGIALLMPSVEKLLPGESVVEKMILNRSRKEKAVRFFRGKIKSSLAASLSISLATLPIQLYFFYTFPVYSVFLNLFIIPLMGFLMAAGAAGLFLACVCPFWGAVFMTPCKWILMVCEIFCRLFDSLPCKNPVLGKPKLWQVAVYYGLLLCVIFWDAFQGRERIQSAFFWKKFPGCTFLWGKHSGKWKFKNIQSVLVICAGVFLLCIRIRGATTLTMLDIGQGDCMVIEEKSGYNILVDGGSSDVSEVGRYRIIPYLKSHGISSLDYVFVSHADSDHISGVLEMLSEEGEEKIEIKHLVLTKFAESDDAYDELLTYANQSGAKILMVSKGDRFEIGNTGWECLYPEMEEEGEGNDQSMVLLMECGSIETLFTGDLPGNREENLIESIGRKNIMRKTVRILKTAHHGSRYSTTEEFLENYCPKTAIVSAGKNNSYGHPHEEVLERLEENGCRVFKTPSAGAITIRYEKGKYSVFTYKKM